MQKQTLSFLALVFILRGRNLFADEEAIETGQRFDQCSSPFRPRGRTEEHTKMSAIMLGSSPQTARSGRVRRSNSP